MQYKHPQSNLIDALVEAVQKDNAYNDITEESRLAEYELLLSLVINGSNNTFLGKRMEISWPDGPPPVVKEVLRELVSQIKCPSMSNA